MCSTTATPISSGRSMRPASNDGLCPNRAQSINGPATRLLKVRQKRSEEVMSVAAEVASGGCDLGVKATEIRRVALDLQDLLLRVGLARVTANFADNFVAADLISAGPERWHAHGHAPALGEQLVRRYTTMRPSQR